MGRWGTIFQPSVDPRELHRQWNLADRPDIAWPEGSEREGAVWRLISWCVETGLLPNDPDQIREPKESNTAEDS